MVQAITDITVAQGIDPAGSTLIGGGGAAGLNSTFVARRLGCKNLIIPETGAALSAAGAMMSDLVNEYAASLFTSTAHFDFEKVNNTLFDLRARCDSFANRAGGGALKTEIEIIAEARYENQVWDIDMPLRIRRFKSPEDLKQFRAAFDDAHEQIFTIRDAASHVEIVGLRATVRCKVKDSGFFRLDGKVGIAPSSNSRKVFFTESGWVDTAIHRLEAMPEGQEFSGPVIIESPFTTIVVDPIARVYKSTNGSIVIQPQDPAL
jgi:N-methylhydantoinase A